MNTVPSGRRLTSSYNQSSLDGHSRKQTALLTAALTKPLSTWLHTNFVLKKCKLKQSSIKKDVTLF